jgi:phosphate transport system permease protein
VLLAAGLIFLHIAYRGAPVLFKPEAPFINLEFLTGHPQTLHVYEPKELQERFRAAQQASNREGELAQFAADDKQIPQVDYERLREELYNASLLYSDEELQQLDTRPDESAYIYSNYAYSAGGIGTAIVGTLLLIVGSICISLLLGVSSAIYLSEYSRPGRMLKIIRLSVLNLSGVPSIVFGLFGFGIFVLLFGWGVSLAAGWFTLALVALPTVIATSEAALRSVPQSYREASLGLGASKWTTVRNTVLPYALPAILTSSILGVARVAGETAAILFTATFALRDRLPWQGLETPVDFVNQGVMALPYHIYVLCAKLPQSPYTRDMQYGTVFVLLTLISLCALSGIYLRQRIRSIADT